MHTLFVTSLVFPIIMAFIAFFVFKFSKFNKSTDRTGQQLFNKSIRYAAIGAGLTLIYTIADMIWYEQTTGYSAGNGPLGWIFFLGPVGAAFGQLLALLKWRYGKTI